MKELHRVEIVDGLLLEWRVYRSAIGPWTSEVSVYAEDEDGDWGLCLSMKTEQADELQCALRVAVLELEAARETEAPESEQETGKSKEQDPFPEGDEGEDRH